MKVLIVGASGMVGNIILKMCLADELISGVISIGRKTINVEHNKLTQIAWKDFNNFTGLESAFRNVDAAYFCIGVYTGAVPDEKFKEITVDYAIAFGEKLKENSPKAILSFLSGAGADQKEKSRTAFARYKGMAENGLIKMNLGGLFVFRPGYIYPVQKRVEPNMMYKISRTLYPLFKLLGKRFSIKSTELAKAMFKVSKTTPSKTVLENDDILNFLT